MPDALTRSQIEIMRRVRAGDDAASGAYVPGLVSEIGFLANLGLLTWDGDLRFSLTPLGAAYLQAAEHEIATSGHPLLDPPADLES